MQQEILVHHEERFHVQFGFHLRHHAEEFLTGVVEIQELALAAEERRGCAEIAAHGAAHRWNDGGGGAALVLRQIHPHGAPSEAGNDGRMADGRGVVFTEVPAHPGDAVAAHEVVGVDHEFNARGSGHMTADYDGGFGRHAPHRAAHLPHLADVDDDGGNTDDVVIVGEQFRFEVFARWKIQDCGGRRDVLLDHQDAPRAMKHAEGKRPLLTRHLVVIELHGVDLAAAELVVLRVRTKHGTEQNTGANALWMCLHFQN